MVVVRAFWSQRRPVSEKPNSSAKDDFERRMMVSGETMGSLSPAFLSAVVTLRVGTDSG